MFYSREIAKRHLDNFCARCEKKFDEWSNYHAHITANTCYKKILPVRTSNRTKVQIVSDIEKTWGNALISY
jgi:hypothetical protein